MVPLGKVCFKFQTNTVKYQTSIVCGQQKAITVSRRITILSFACPGLSPSWVVRLGLKYSQKVHLDGLFFFFLLPGTHCYTLLPYLILWPPLVQRQKITQSFLQNSKSPAHHGTRHTITNYSLNESLNWINEWIINFSNSLKLCCWETCVVLGHSAHIRGDVGKRAP